MTLSDSLFVFFIFLSFRALRVRCSSYKTSNNDQPLMIGDILTQQIPTLNPYIEFCSYQLNASTFLQEKLDSSAEFKAFVKVRLIKITSELLKPTSSRFCRLEKVETNGKAYQSVATWSNLCNGWLSIHYSLKRWSLIFYEIILTSRWSSDHWAFSSWSSWSNKPPECFGVCRRSLSSSQWRSKT